MVSSFTTSRCVTPIAPLGAEVGRSVPPFQCPTDTIVVAGPSRGSIPEGIDTPDVLAAATREILRTGVEVVSTLPATTRTTYWESLIAACIARGATDAYLERSTQPRWVAGRITAVDRSVEEIVAGLLDGGVDLFVVDRASAPQVTEAIEREHRRVPVIGVPTSDGSVVVVDGHDRRRLLDALARQRHGAVAC